MKDTSSDTPDIDRVGSGARPKAHGYFRRSNRSGDEPTLPVTEPSVTHKNDQSTSEITQNNNENNGVVHASHSLPVGDESLSEKPVRLNTQAGPIAPATSSQDERQGSLVEAKGDKQQSDTKPKRTLMEEIRRSFWMIVTYSWLNVLLIFVPIGIIVAEIDGIHGGIVFAMNCIAVIPLAGLLAFATESVASNMGDALGALLNVTFGNAVELIIFIIALVKNEIRIVQASLLGSILANLLLILGMGFFLGGLRYREQIYNSTVTQMSACLLSLSVISLVLPTAFHASFSDSALADKESLKISRGTSVILLLVYGIYLLFQLKSHAYMYESTPQHIVDAESTPGPAAAWLDSSSSDSSSSSSSDSDDSDHSHGTMRKKMKKLVRHGRRRKSSLASVDTNELHGLQSPSIGTSGASPHEEVISEASSSRPQFPRVPSIDDSDDEDDKSYRRRRRQRRHRRKQKKNKKRAQQHDATGDGTAPTISEKPENALESGAAGEPRRVDFAIPQPQQALEESGTAGTTKRPFPALRGMSVKNLAPTVFVQKPDLDSTTAGPSGPVPRVRYGIRRTNSLPDRLNQQTQFRAPGAMLPAHVPLIALANGPAAESDEKDHEDEHLTKAASIILLLVSTGLVALCAEFLVGSIEEVVSSSSIGEIFIGLIILPIVGNAAEHVTAITVAMKNKMDLAIGVAVGSSIQIAIFVTPLVVILGWIIDRDMTLYFTLFETVCLFVSAFIVNFLVLDGRSNYLEGALLCAVYIIIGVVAFFYPDGEDASSWGE